eukprot:s624_g2.t1
MTFQEPELLERLRNITMQGMGLLQPCSSIAALCLTPWRETLEREAVSALNTAKAIQVSLENLVDMNGSVLGKDMPTEAEEALKDGLDVLRLPALPTRSLFQYLIADAEPVDEKKWGSQKCRCIGYDGAPGRSNVSINGAAVPYPAEAGASCEAWDEKNHPDCLGDKPAAWCKMSWCYVDPCECQLEVPPKTSSYLPKGRGNGKPIYFSYAACGAEDEYTKGNEEACVNQDVESNCTKLEKCAWTGKQCLGKELVEVCSSANSVGLFGLLGAVAAGLMAM